MLKRQADGVESFKQAVFPKRIDVEAIGHPVWRCHGLSGQVDTDLIALFPHNIVKQRLYLVRFQHDRQHTVLKAVVVENVGKARRDEAAKALIEERPRRVFPRGAAAKVIAGQENGGLPIAWLVQEKVRILRSILFLPPIEKQS